MRGIAISWSKDNIFQKKPFILYFIFKKKQKNQTLHWLAGHPIYGHHPRNTSRWTPEAFRGWCDHPWRFWGGLCHSWFSSRVAGLASGVAAATSDWLRDGCGHPQSPSGVASHPWQVFWGWRFSLGVALHPRFASRVVAATLGSWWSATHGFSILFFFVFLFF